MLIRLTAFAGLLAIAACVDSAPAVSNTLVRDSASVQIVEFPATVYSDFTARTDTPRVARTVGTVAGAEHEQFFRLGTVQWLDQDRVVLSNAGAEIRMYSSDGSWIRTFGREGEGPEEFQSIRAVLPTSQGDLVIVDQSARRLMLADSTGRILRTVSLDDRIPERPRLVRDSLIVGRLRTNLIAGGGGTLTERTEDSVAALSTRTGEREVTFPIPGYFVSWVKLEGLSFAAPFGTSMSPVPRITARGRQVVTGVPEAYELKLRDEDFTVVRIIRVEKPAIQVTDEMRAFITDDWVETGVPRAAWTEIADSVPHFREIELDHAQRLWVRLDHGAGEPDLEWDVFDPDQSAVHRLHLPDGFTFRDANDTMIVGVFIDELGVEYLQFLDLPESLHHAP